MDTSATKIRDANTKNGRRANSIPDQAGLLSGDKLLALVELLMRSTSPLSARAIAETLVINRSTTHRALNTLIHRGWVERRADAADYRLSVKFLALVHVSVQVRSFLQEVRPFLEQLSVLSRETVHVGVLDGFEVLHIDKIDSLERVGVSSKIGSRGPAHTASLGKALLAASPDEAVEEYIAGMGGGHEADGEFDPETFRADVRSARERGFSVDDEEDAVGVRCLGVAIRGAGGIPLFAISLTGPAGRFTFARVEALAPEVMAIVAELSRRLGGESPGHPSADGNGSLDPAGTPSRRPRTRGK